MSEHEHLAIQINDAHSAARQSMRDAVEHAVKAGELLAAAKEQIGHGRWLSWVGEHCEFSARTAQAYMRLARQWPALRNTQRVADLPLREALIQLAEPRRRPIQEELAEVEAEDRRIRLALSVYGRAVRDSGTSAGELQELIGELQRLEQDAGTLRMRCTRRLGQLLGELRLELGDRAARDFERMAADPAAWAEFQVLCAARIQELQAAR